MKRTVVDGLKIDEGKPGRIQTARCAILVIGQLEASIARTKGDSATPGERCLAAPDCAAVGVDRLRVAVESMRIVAQIRSHALACLDAIPAAGDNRAHLHDAEGCHHRIMSIIAPSEADAFRVARSLDQRVKEIRCRCRIGWKLAVIQKFRDGSLRFRALHAINRIGVVPCNHQQALNAGEA